MDIKDYITNFVKLVGHKEKLYIGCFLFFSVLVISCLIFALSFAIIILVFILVLILIFWQPAGKRLIFFLNELKKVLQ